MYSSVVCALLIIFFNIAWTQEISLETQNNQTKNDKIDLFVLIPKVRNFRNESTLSVVQSGGNSNVETYNAKSESTFKVGINEFSSNAHYTLGVAKIPNQEGKKIPVETARNWHFSLKYAREQSEDISQFGGVKYESDRFAGYAQRNNYDYGLKFKLVKLQNLESQFEFGLRYTTEFRTTPNREGDTVIDDKKGRLFYELVHSPQQQYRYKIFVEYLPNFSRPDDYIITLGPSLSSFLTDMFSINISYRMEYRNEPAILGNDYVDYLFTTGVTAKF
jgi:putative salt-induced outer membrane protein YdiY